MTLEQLLIANLAAAIGLFLLLWIASLLRRDASIVDPFWGFSFVVVAWLSIALGGQSTFRPLLIATLVSIWGLRLTGYLTWRNWGKAEDYRYTAMRERHGYRFPIVSLLTVFGLQAVLMWVISLPVQVGILRAQSWTLVVILGSVIWGLGLFFESVGDFQLARFKADPANRGQLMNRGLWRYTRHPNYFGDFLVWWGLYLVSAEPGSWWWTVIGPVVMSILLIRVSGVRLLESSLKSRVAGYEEYVRRTSAFIPLPPKRSSQAT